ncbi:MAG: fibronectin type III domain-containing protein [Bacteroidota bacterium]
MKTIVKTIVGLVVACLLSVSCIEDNIIDAPVFPPSAVEGFTATAGDAEVRLTWMLNSFEKITDYEITYAPDGNIPQLVSKDSSSFTVTGLTNGTEYTFSILAKNGNQASEPVTVSSTPIGLNLSGPELSLFSFLATDHPHMALDTNDIVDLNASIDQSTNSVTLSPSEVSAYIYIDSLAPTFTVPAGAEVSVEGEIQVSGESYQDFSNPIQYSVTLDGNTRAYTVSVTKNQYATIPDAAFLGWLKSSLDASVFNENDQLDITATAVREFASGDKMNLDGVGIADMKGIEFFVGAREADAENNTFSSINLSKNMAMRNVLVGLNPNIESITTGDKTNIELLYINGALKLEAEDIQPIIDANTGLRRLYAFNGNSITQLDVSNLVSMERLRFDESLAMASAASINAMLAKNPPIASDTGNLRVYVDGTDERCDSYDPVTYECQ